MVTTINPSDQTITQYNIQTGGASNLLNNVAPSATSGVPVISQGAASQPIFGTAVVAGGGTGQTTLTNHGVLVGAGTSAITQLATGSAGQALLSGGASADPAYSTPTYPSASGSAGQILRSDGTNNVYTTATYPATTTSNRILYSSADNVIGQITTANSGVLVTSSAGVPSIDTTDFQVLSTGVQMKGNNTNTAPPAGFIGEQIRSALAAASQITLTTNTPANVTSITLSAGIWDISGIVSFGTNAATSSTAYQIGIGTTSATIPGNFGDDSLSITNAAILNQSISFSIPSLRVTLSGSTVYYLVCQATFTLNAKTAYGRISATRVG